MADKKTGIVKAKGFSLDQFDSLTSEEGVWMTLKNPADSTEELLNTTGKPMQVCVVGPDSPTYRSSKNEMFAKRLSGVKVSKKQVNDMMGDIASKMLDDDKSNFIVNVTKGWKNFELKAGEDLKFSKSKAAEVFEQYPWICDQIDIFLGDRENFLSQ